VVVEKEMFMPRFVRVSLVEGFQEWLQALLGKPGSLSGLWEEAGSIMDPDG
jgi:hypothetical protein